MKFKSKIGAWFHLTVIISLAATALPIVLVAVREDITQAPPVLFIATGAMLIAISVLILPAYFNTYYTLEETVLHIRCGFFVNQRIPYKDIKTMHETKDPLASAGLSFDRIAINYSEGAVLISPVNKQEFIKQLIQRIENE